MKCKDGDSYDLIVDCNTMLREMTSDNGLNSDGDVVIEAVRRAEEEEVLKEFIIVVIITTVTNAIIVIMYSAMPCRIIVTIVIINDDQHSPTRCEVWPQRFAAVLREIAGAPSVFGGLTELATTSLDRRLGCFQCHA